MRYELMTNAENIKKLKDARDKCAEVFEKEAKDEVFDNGNLDNIHKAICHIQVAIKEIEARG